MQALGALATRRRPPRSLQGKRVLITGGSSGIGLACGHALSREGARVALLARPGDALREAAASLDPPALTVTADVADSASLTAAVGEAATALGGLDAVVANAGAAVYGPFRHTSPEDYRRTVEVVLLGVMNTAHAALPLLERSQGTLVVVGSVAGQFPVPWLATYGAAKHGVRGFVRALKAELRAMSSPVQVALIAPGPVDTPFWKRARTTDGRLPPEIRGAYRPEDAAAEVLRALRRPRTERTLGAAMVAWARFDALAPEVALRLTTAVAPLGWRGACAGGHAARRWRAAKQAERAHAPARPGGTAVTDVIVIGAGPNGLVAANILADAGFGVLVCEEQPVPGGAVRSAELTVPGFQHDVFSAFYPFAVSSPVIRSLDLEKWGLIWRRAPLAVAHPTADNRTAVLSTDVDRTAESLDRFAAGDGDSWRRLYDFWSTVEEQFMEAFTTPFPPVAAASRLTRDLSVRQLLALARTAVIPLRRFSEENFRGEGGGLLLGGNALHADLTVDSPGGALFGWILCGLGQRHGFPFPQGGAGRLTDALVERLHARGGEVLCDAGVQRILTRDGAAVGVSLDDREIHAAVGVLADVGAPQLYRRLVGEEHLPPRFVRDLERFQYDNSTIKVDWALSKPIPWTSKDARLAGTVHVADSLEQLADATSSLERQVIPNRPFLVMGQYGSADPTRQPPGADTAWAYTHVPQKTRGDARGELTGSWDARELEAYAGRMEDEIERLAPGFRDTILGRNVWGPHEAERMNRNLVGGAVNGGTAKLHQQAIFRPVPGLGRPETPVRDLYLASASAHPGGGVHGAPGANAARALLRRHQGRRIATLPLRAARSVASRTRSS